MSEVQAEQRAATEPWNWCPFCDQEVDLPGEFCDGTEVECSGCKTRFTATAFANGGDVMWGLVFVDDSPDSAEEPS